jgi:myo-inositol 2-dehydrogenase/D-chiro-inositol 1-dehydrogenase/scyllo-inositol 2-dehydrogenase (NAD+)
MVHARNFRWRVPYGRLAALVDTDAERAQKAATELDLENAHYTSLEQALTAAQFDAVVITTPTFTHAELAVLAAQAGKHILCEKPMALNLQECDQIIAAASQAGVVLQMAFMRRFDPPFVAARKQIDDGLIGMPIIVRSLTRGPGLPPQWAWDVNASNGMLAEVNSHDFDSVRWLAGSNYTSVFARATTLKAPEIKAQYPDFYDTAIVSLQMENGAMGMIDGVCPVHYGYDARAEVLGTDGILVIGELRETAMTRVTRASGIVEQHFVSWPLRFKDAYIAEATDFVACIREQKLPVATGSDGRRALEAVLAANQSIRTGQPVALPLAPE